MYKFYLILDNFQHIPVVIDKQVNGDTMYKALNKINEGKKTE